MSHNDAPMITVRDLKRLGLLAFPPAPLRADEIKEIRVSNNASQGTFATKLGASLSTIQKWESGSNCPTGVALKLLHVVRKHGLAILDAP
jgi:putative transcriptional regulator